MFLLRGKIPIKSIFTLLFYIIIPSIAILIILTTYPEISKERFIRMIYCCVSIGILLFIVSIISPRYEKGTDRRFYINIFYIFLTLLWLYGFLGGSLVIDQTWMNFKFSIHLWRYIIVIITAALMNIIYYYFEWKVFKRESFKKIKLSILHDDVFSHNEINNFIDKFPLN
jgi:hypothetical protein